MAALPAVVVLVSGCGMWSLCWLAFRKPGVSYWGWQPTWRWGRHLTPPGVALWVAGWVCWVSAMALLLVQLARLSGPA